MNFKELQQAEKKYDELMVIGKNIKKQGRIYHIAGMTRYEKQAVLYVLEQEDFGKNEIEESKSQKEHTNRMNMKSRYYFQICFGRAGRRRTALFGLLTGTKFREKEELLIDET